MTASAAPHPPTEASGEGPSNARSVHDRLCGNPTLPPKLGGGPPRVRGEGAKPPLGYGAASGPIENKNAKRGT